MGDAADLDALTRDAVRVDLSGGGPLGRELIVATGADRVRFLNGLVTGKVAGTPVGDGCRAALLTTKGHVVADLTLFLRAEDVRLVIAAGQAESVAAALSRYAIMDDFSAVARPDARLLAVLGPAAAQRLHAAGIDVGGLAVRPPFAHADVAGLWLARVRELGQPGFWVGGSGDELAPLDGRLAAAGVPRLSPELAEAARIAALEPRWGAEITADYFPMEVGLSSAIDYAKGCYLGQEPIVRIRDRGHINWRLVGLDVTVSGQPVAGDALESDVKPKAGRISSAARLPDGRGVALALLHVSVPVGATVRIKHGDQLIPAVVRAEADAVATTGAPAGP
jgi:folate-binding protein YgfZ